MRENSVENGVVAPENGVLNGVGLDPVAEFLSACGSAPDGAVVRVARVVSGTRQYLPETVEPAEFAPEWLGERFGGGRYFVSLVVPGRGYSKGCTVSVVGPAAGAPPAAPVAGVAAAAPLDASSLMAAALTLLQSTMTQQTQVLSALLARPSDGLKPADLLALVKGNGGGGLSDAVDALRGLAELSGGLGGGGGSGGGGSSDPMAAVAAAVLPSLLAASKAAPAAAAAPARPRRPVTPQALEARAARLEAAAAADRAAAAARRSLAPAGRSTTDLEAAARAAAASDWVRQRAELEAAAASTPPAPTPPAPTPPAAVDASELVDGCGMDAAGYAAARERIGKLFASVGGAPEWLNACIREACDDAADGAELGAAIVAACERENVEVPHLDELETAAVLDVVTVGRGDEDRRRRWIGAVCGPVADALADAVDGDDDADGEAGEANA